MWKENPIKNQKRNDSTSWKLFVWYSLRRHIFTLSIIFPIRNDPCYVGICKINGIIVCTILIRIFEHSVLLRIAQVLMVIFMPMLSYLNIISQPKARKTGVLWLDTNVHRKIHKICHQWYYYLLVISVYFFLPTPTLIPWKHLIKPFNDRVIPRI